MTHQAKPDPLCRNCAHYNGDKAFPRCTHKALAKANLVTGGTNIADCYPERERGHKCGPSGKLFIAKHK